MQTNDEILGIKIQKYGLDKEAKPNEKGFYDYKDEAEFTDYSNAISLYKKTFPKNLLNMMKNEGDFALV